jgi:CRISPR-associated protein Cmr3
MKTSFLTITPHDPIIARDGRPFGFGQGIRMKSLDWLYPSVLAGSLRTMIGKKLDENFSENTIKLLKSIRISGPLPLIKGKVYLPAPKDIIVKETDEGRWAYAIRPNEIKKGEGCDLPEGILPSVLSESEKEDFKPAKVPAFWSVDVMTSWLTDPKVNAFVAPPDPEKIKKGDGFIDLPKKERRTHVEIDFNRGTSTEHKLFETVGLDLQLKGQKEGIQLAARIESGKDISDLAGKIDSFCTIGGERRLAGCRIVDSHDGWNCPEKLVEALEKKKKVSMVLATPAIFSDGWKPGWLNGWPKNEAPEGWPDGLNLKLISACIDRWKPISGWCLENGKFGPKAVRRIVPAGSVYFFEIVDCDLDAGHLAKAMWLKAVSDKKQDRMDGFGLAVFGSWSFSD